MGASVGPNKGGAKSDINVTPLIDIVLVLLIVFIVMVPGMTKAAKVTVPQVVTTQTPPPQTKDIPLVLTIDQEGKIDFNSIPVQVREIAEKLVPEIEKQPTLARKVTLKIDEEITYQQAVDVLDQIRVAEEKVKKNFGDRADRQGDTGGDVKVLISMKKRNA